MNTLWKIGSIGMAGVLLFGVFTGCGELRSAQPDDGTASSSPSWHFVEGRGVKLSERGIILAGLQLSEAVPGDLGEQASIAGVAQVLFAGRSGGGARASVLLSPDQAGGIEVGALVEAGGAGGASHRGQVERIDRQAAAAAGQVELILNLEDDNGALREGMFLTCRILQEPMSGGHALTIPLSALLSTARGDFVYVVNGEHFFRSPVQSGLRGRESVEIVDGLFDGDVVVSAGLDYLWLVELQAINGGEACADGH